MIVEENELEDAERYLLGVWLEDASYALFKIFQDGQAHGLHQTVDKPFDFFIHYNIVNSHS